MSKRKKSRTVHGRDGERDVSPTRSRSDNPIIAAVLPSLQRQQLVPVVDNFQSIPKALLRESVRLLFSNDAIREVGTLVCLALLTGDKRVIKTVRDAVKQSDHLFNRDREIVLVKHVLTYLPSLMSDERFSRTIDGRRVLDIAAIKKEIEKLSNCSNPLSNSTWSKLRKVLHLEGKLPTGAAAPAYKKSRAISRTKRRKLCNT
jgi:hypothetical protein